MATPATKPNPLRPRLGRLTWRLAWTALAVWIVWLAVTRWNGVPADPRIVEAEYAPVSPIDPARDRTAELLASLDALPIHQAFALPQPPPGLRWRDGQTIVYVNTALSATSQGEWLPEKRVNLALVVSYLQRPEMDEALARLAAIRPGGYRTTEDAKSKLTRVIKLFVARARYQDAGLGEVDAALDDLDSAYRLVAFNYDSGRPVTLETLLTANS